MLLSLLISMSAHAYDVDLDVSVHGAEPVPLTLHDVRPGVLRGAILPGIEDHDHRVLVQLQEGGADHAGAVTVTLTLEEVNVQRRRVEVESRPRMTVLMDQPAQMGIDVVLPKATDEKPVATGAEIQLVVHPDAATDGS